MRYFVTGGGGFIGSNLVDALAAANNTVVVYDNFTTGRRRFLDDAVRSGQVTVVEGDLLDRERLTVAMRGCDFVFHLGANADVRFGLTHPEKDLQQNTIATFNVLEAMHASGLTRLAFSSTGSIYGEPAAFPTPENAPFPIQTSLYGASKLACEGLIQAYSEGFGFQSYIFRFVSILGERYSHGHVFDFYRNLRKNPHNLTILGNGKQRKSYLYVKDCVSAMLQVIDSTVGKVNIFNLGSDAYCTVDESAAWICRYMGCSPVITYTGGERGWIGDSPFIFLDCEKVRSLGWRPSLTIQEAVVRTLEYLAHNQWVFGE